MVRLTDRPAMTLTIYHGRKTTTQHDKKYIKFLIIKQLLDIRSIFTVINVDKSYRAGIVISRHTKYVRGNIIYVIPSVHPFVRYIVCPSVRPFVNFTSKF